MREGQFTIKRSTELTGTTTATIPGTRGGLDDPRWHLAQRIAVSRSIGRSPLLSEFLLYVCDRHLRDKTSELTEQRIGVQVFGRTEGYNSNDDNIVRNYARTLRKRVDEYFATEGRYEDLRLEIPRGGYAPVFSPRFPEKLLTLGELETALPPISTEASTETSTKPHSIATAAEDLISSPVAQTPAVRPKNYFVWLGIVALLVIGTLSLVAVSIRHGANDIISKAGTGQEESVLWSQLFQKDRDTFIVPADSGLVIMQGLTHQPVALGDYASGSYRTAVESSDGVSASTIIELGTRRYTSIVDLDLVNHLSRLKEVVPERMLIRYARDLRMDDLRSGNAILLGSVDSNPWEELFQQQLNFRFSFSPKNDTAPTIINLHPKPGEQAIYANRHLGSWHNTFAVIAYLPNLDGTGHVLLVGGLNMAGTQAAGDFVLNPVLMKPTLDHARAPNGNLLPFEILIATDNVAANASRPHVVSERIGPA